MKVKIVYPVYNDWEALNLLMTKTAAIFEKQEVELSYLAVDDCSSVPFIASDFSDFVCITFLYYNNFYLDFQLLGKMSNVSIIPTIF
jgi:hypothetical protein